MALTAGARLGPYEILAPLGAGGMGEVYRARDTRLDRTVAIKVLPAELARDASRRQRLEREAKAISQLSHPHICTLHDVGREGETDFLVMEYLEGETLAHRLEKGPLPLEQALRVGSEIADALDKAHRQGVVHRDLKPGNVMLTKSGAKLLDFGLAKLRDAGSADEGVAVSALPTEAKPLTEEGRIVGTYPYMAPEQLEGGTVDARTDIFAFGAVLYEMVTGQRAFEGKSRASLIAAILSSEPRPISELRPMTPPLLDRVVRRCLVKDPDVRWQSAADLADELRWIAEGGGEGGEKLTAGARLERGHIFAWVVSVVAAAGLGALLASSRGERPPANGLKSGTASTPVTRSVIELPPEAPLALGETRPQIGFDSPLIALSPDGARLVYVGESDDGRRLYLRSLDTEEARPIPGTEGAFHPFFSPDGRSIGFLTTDKVMKVALHGGAPLTLCDIAIPVRASWARDGSIYVADRAGFSLARVPETGGEAARVVELVDGGLGSIGQVLPDGKWALVTDYSRGTSGDHADILLLSLETLEAKLLIESGYDARYLSSGHLLFARSGGLMAVPLDLERLQVSGEPTTVARGVSMESFWAQTQVAVSDNGTLVYVPGGDRSVGRLAWVDRQGHTEFLPVAERRYGVLDLSPDGRRVAVHVADVRDYIWIYDLGRDEGRKLTASGAAGWPAWAPDGSRIAFQSWGTNDTWRILLRTVDDSVEPRELLSSEELTMPESWSRDGRLLAVNQWAGRTGLLSTDGSHRVAWEKNDWGVWGLTFSRDGRWMAYISPETGRNEIWVRSHPDGGTTRQISLEGGIEPVWCDECDELFFRRGNSWLSTIVSSGPELDWESPRVVFETEFVDTVGRSYDVSPDGRRLLVVKSPRAPTRTRVHLVQGWFAEREARVHGAGGKEAETSP